MVSWIESPLVSPVRRTHVTTPPLGRFWPSTRCQAVTWSAGVSTSMGLTTELDSPVVPVPSLVEVTVRLTVPVTVKCPGRLLATATEVDPAGSASSWARHRS